MCSFKKKENFQIGKVLQFCYYMKKKVSEYHYQGTFAQTKQADLGVLCTWFQDLNGLYTMCKSENHCYIPLENYICTLPRPCFIINTPSSQAAKNMVFFEQFALKPTCKEFIVHNIGRNKISQPAQCLQGTEQCVMTKAEK